MSRDLDFLSLVCKQLERQDIAYFLCHGTLLGLIRSGGLIEGDRDVDLGFLHDEVSIPALLDALDATGAEIVWRAGKQLPILAIPGSSRKVDLNIYVPVVAPGNKTGSSDLSVSL